MDKKNLPVRRRITPFTPLNLLLREPDGNRQIDLKLSFDMNAGVAIQEQTGYPLTDASIWNHVSEPKVLRAMLWAAALAHQPEYDGYEGLATIGSYIQGENSEQIVEALWTAYLAYVSPGKREFLLRAKAEAEERAKQRETNGASGEQ